MASRPHIEYFSDRCPKTVFGNEIASPCSLKLGHEGPCKPQPLPQSRVTNQHSEPDENVAYANTDRELWREGDPEDGMSYYEPSIHVTEQGGIGINVGGTVYVRTLREWHGLVEQLRAAHEEIEKRNTAITSHIDQKTSLLEQLEALQAAVDEGYEWKGEAGRLQEQLEAARTALRQIQERETREIKVLHPRKSPDDPYPPPSFRYEITETGAIARAALSNPAGEPAPWTTLHDGVLDHIDRKRGEDSSPAIKPNGEQTREQLLERLALTVKEAIDGGAFVGTLFETQVSGTLWLLYGEQSPAISPLCECGHSRENHRGADMSVGRAPCRATVFTEAPLGGGNAFTCHCRDYVPATSRCEKCKHDAHDPGDCRANVGTGYMGPVLCRCGVPNPARGLHYEEDGSGTALPPIEESAPEGLEPRLMSAPPFAASSTEGVSGADEQSPATSSEGALSEQAREPVSRGALPSEAHVPAKRPT